MPIVVVTKRNLWKLYIYNQKLDQFFIFNIWSGFKAMFFVTKFYHLLILVTGLIF